MEHTLAVHIGREVRAEMARQRVSQRKLAACLGRSQNVVSQRLAGRIEFRPSELETVAAALGVPVAQFLPQPTPVAA